MPDASIQVSPMLSMSVPCPHSRFMLVQATDQTSGCTVLVSASTSFLWKLSPAMFQPDQVLVEPCPR